MQKQYSFILSNHTFTVSNEYDLIALLKIFSKNTKTSSIIHWNILMELDSDLESIITSYQWLMECLKYLNQKNGYLLLIKLWDVLIHIIQNSKNLWEIISSISEEENKIKLLKELRTKGLKKIFTTMNDIINVLQWIYFEQSQKEFLDLIGKDFFKNLFFTSKSLYILYYLHPENKNYMIDMIGMKHIKKTIKTHEDFLIVFQSLTENRAKTFLKLFSKEEIVHLFPSEEQWSMFLLQLSQKKEKIFLHYLYKHKHYGNKKHPSSI